MPNEKVSRRFLPVVSQFPVCCLRN